MARIPQRKRTRRRSQVDPLRPDLTKLFKSRSKKRGLTTLQKLQRKARRSAISFLKKKGLAPLGKSASAQRRAIRKYKSVIEKKEQAYRLPPNFPKQALKDLKAAGYKVRRGKLILPRGQYSRKGKVYVKAVGKRRGGRLDHITLTANFEQQIRDAFAGLKPGEWVAFSINGSNSYNVFRDADALIRELLEKYHINEWSHPPSLTIFRVSDVSAYEGDANQRRLSRQRKRKAMSEGMRIRRRNKG